MIARAYHQVNLGLPAPADLPAVPGLDLALSADNVARFGGDPRRYRHALSGISGAPEAVVNVAAVAAWRAGVLGIRDDALSRLQLLPIDLAASVLGLPVDAVVPFTDGQAVDRFYWPLRQPGQLIARIGGFTGLGGRWDQPPTDPTPRGPGRWTVHVGAQRWQIDADVFGHVISDAPAAGPQIDRPGPAQLVVRPTSYLAEIWPA
ncbi:potassium transporter Kef [Mycobacterium sp. DL440]|uniref:potassium transporter Kef n=1 Tax=Mycobacterium sp. DL440 TaxID=2675523 RepID=UPI00142405AA|nr:potassium transporter Kef [Mycobacterium sp. DL440]